MDNIIKYIPIIGLVIAAIFISGCTGAQVVSPTPTPTAQIIYVTATPMPAPVSYFSFSPGSGNAPLEVSFTDESNNNPTSWYWSFGDGTTSTDKDPMHVYSQPGTYTVSLTVTNSGGSNTNTNYITVNAEPTAQVIYVTPVPTPAPTQAPEIVYITAFNGYISYTGTTGYFGPATQVMGSAFQTNAGSTFTDTITFTSSAAVFSHPINSITIQTPGFTLLSTNPSLPTAAISPGSSIAITLTIQAPSSSYDGPLDIDISTS